MSGMSGQPLFQFAEQRPWVMSVILLILIGAADFFVLMQSQVAKLATINPEISQLSGTLNAAKTEIARREQYRQNSQNLREEIVRLNLLIRTKEEVPLILENISRLASQNGVKVDQIMPMTTTSEPIMINSDGKYYSIPIAVEARSGYHEFGRFMNHMETEGVFFKMYEFKMAARGESAKQHFVHMIMDTVILEKENE
jgi:Tfp pilus assembly protein PilO